MPEPAPEVPAAHLAVWRERRLVGRLWQAGPRRTLVFAYEWPLTPPRQPISQSLPLREAPHEGPEVEAFFGNLLPEGDVRTAVSRALQISERNDYALLEALGGDCAGALILMPPGVAPPEPAAGGEELAPGELARLVEALPRRPLLAGENGLRLSLAGAQPKLALSRSVDRWLAPANGAISTHILKPPLRDLPGTVENEAFCMALAARCGIGAPESWIEPEPRLYVVARYDRERAPATGQVRRLHQEDFCQALGIPASRKYEAEGGPSLADCFALIRRVSSEPAGDLLRLLDWVIFNFFIGNHDAHAKNLSLLYRHGEVRLAPFYDLLCTAAYAGLTERFAMRIGGAESPRYMTLRHWERFAEECGLTTSLWMSRVTGFLRRFQIMKTELANDFEPTRQLVSSVLRILDDRARLFTNMIEADNARRNGPRSLVSQPKQALPMNPPKRPLVVVDASGWLFRAYHALPPLTNAKGEPTGAIHGMVNMLRKLLRDYAPEHIAVVFDAPGKTFRDEISSAYKANRDATPPDLLHQWPIIVRMVAAMGLPVLEVPGVEADDVIGTLARLGEADGHEVLIVTSDKDMAQLVNERVRLVDTMKVPVRVMDPAGVVEKFGVPPSLIVDYLTLIGDTSDNIAGVPGVGPKTAAKWLAEHGSLDAIVAAAESIKGKVGENLRASLAQIPVSRELATIRCDVPLPKPLDELVPGDPEIETLAAIYREAGLRTALAELTGEAASPAGLASQSDPAPAGSASEAAADAPGHELPTTGLPAELRGKTRVTTVLDEAALDALVAALEAAPLVCVDTETDALDSMGAGLVGLAFATEPGHGWYVPLTHDYLGAPKQLDRAAVLARVRPVLEDPAKPKLGQHIKYDLNVLMRHGVQVRGVACDTMLESYVLDAAGNRHDMDTLAAKYLDHQTIKFEDVCGKGKNQLTFNQVSVEQAAEYSAEDADITLRLHRVLHPKLAAEPALLKVFDEIEMPLVPVLAGMEQAGVKVDVALLARISTELARRADELQAECFKEAGGEFNLGSPKQLQVILYEQLKLPVLGKTPKGDPSTAESVLEELAPLHPLPRLILEWRGVQKLRSTYTETLPKQVNPATGRIHTSYHQAVAATGRLSSNDPNLQNIPVRNADGRRIRQAFVPEAGQTLLSIDYSQVELRLMAHFSGDERLQAAFHQGLDTQQATAAEVFGLPLDEVPGERRRAAKAINFGLIYGMSAFGLARQLGIPRGEAQDYIDRFFARYPGVRRYMDETRARAHETGYVETLFGRRLYLPDINSRNQGQRQYAERTAINAPLQGTAADLIKRAMIDVAAWLPQHAPGTRMILQVHDELVFEGPEAELPSLAPLIAGRMVAAAQLAVPLVADYGLGPDWDAAHTASGHVSSAQSPGV